MGVEITEYCVSFFDFIKKCFIKLNILNLSIFVFYTQIKKPYLC